jgi:hypothetical protein
MTQIYSSWELHVANRSESSNTYDIIIGLDILGELDIIMNFNDHTVTWVIDTIPMKNRETAINHHKRP